MATWTQDSDIKKRWITNKPLPKKDTLDTFIEDVERQILIRFPDIQQRINDSEVEKATVVANVSRIIIEYLQTEGQPFSQETQAYTGVASRSVTTATAFARFDLILSATDFSFFAPKDNQSKIIRTMKISKMRKGRGLSWGEGC